MAVKWVRINETWYKGMSAKADKRPPLRLTVDREANVEATAERAADCDPVADLARALLDGGAATCVTDRRGELI